jgi:hypothetical protein
VSVEYEKIAEELNNAQPFREEVCIREVSDGFLRHQVETIDLC